MGRSSGTLAHLFPRDITSSKPFTAPSVPRKKNRPPAFPGRPDPAAHARHLLQDLAAAGSTAKTLDAERRKALLVDAAGIFVDVDFVPNRDFPLKALEDLRAGIELVTVTDLGAERARATLFVPDGMLRVLEDKINAFAPLNPKEKPKRKALISSLDSIRRSVTSRAASVASSPLRSSRAIGTP